MNNEIKEILEFKENADYKRLSVDEITILEDYITNLQEENEHLDKVNCHLRKKINNDIYKSRNEKAINEVIRILQIILEQPSKDKLDDLWIINRLEGIQTLLQGSDKDE